MSEDPKTKLLLELITKEVVMPTKHPEPTSSTSTFLRFKPHKFLSFSCLLSYTLLAVLWCQPCSSCTSPGKRVLGLGNGPGLRLHLLRNVVHQQQDSCQTPPSRSLSRNEVGLVFLLPFEILVSKGVSCPCRESAPRQEAAAEAGGEGSTDPAGQGTSEVTGTNLRGLRGAGSGDGKGKGQQLD